MAADIPARVGHVSSPLRWAGGKRWLLPTIKELAGDREFCAYHEPFLGGASVFLGMPAFSTSFLRDTNAELISTYRAIRDYPEEIAQRALTYGNDSETYYRVRDESPTAMIEKAARFLFLNHTSFNGIYRVNLEGVYNVPFGHRPSPRIPALDHLRDVAGRLKHARLDIGDFAGCLDRIQDGDLVFLDPPYTIAHNNNGFVKYNQKIFSFEDQKRLSALIDEIKGRGAYYILANAAHESIGKLFKRRGDQWRVTWRRNSIGGINAKRGSGAEYLFSNLPTAR